MKTSLCKGCNKPIVWGETSEGRRIPLDPGPAIYAVGETSGGTITAERSKEHMVTHFATCPKASDFSGKKDAKPDPQV